MIPKPVFLFFLFVLLIHFLSGQCPDKKMVWDRIGYLKNNRVNTDEQLKELLDMRVKMDSCHFQYDSAYYLLLQRIGVMHFKKAHYTEAAAITVTAISLIHASGSGFSENSSRLLDCYKNLGFYYDSLRWPGKKNEIIDSCVSIAVRTHSVDETVLGLLVNKAEYLLNTGDYHESIVYATLGEQLAKKLGFENAEISKELFGWKINAFLLLYRYDSASTLIKQKINGYRLLHDNKYLGNLYSLYAKCFSASGKPDSALYYLQQSFNFSLRLKQREVSASALNDIGFLYFDKLHDYDKSLYYCRKAMQYSNTTESISILDNMANALLKKGLYDSAFLYFQRAFNQISPGIDENHLLSMPANFLNNNPTEYIITLILDKADARFEKYKRSNDQQDELASLAIFSTADKLLNKIKLEQTQEQSRLFWRKNARRLYEHAIDACWRGQNTALGFYFFEKSRAVLLIDQLKEQQWLNNEEIIQLALLNRKITESGNSLGSATDSSKTFSTENKLIELTNDLTRLKKNIRGKNPLYYQSFIDTSFQSLTDFQASLSKNQQSLVSLFAGDSAVYVLVVTENKSKLSRVDKYAFDSLLNQFRARLANESLINKEYHEFTDVAGQLFRLLFKNNPLPGGRIIVSPDGLSFPFDALVTNTNSNEPAYVLMDHPISYTYSARYLQNNFSAPAAIYTGNFLGFAPVQYPHHAGMAALTGSAESMDRINALFSNTQNMVGNAASRRNFMKQFPGYRVIQLYTHASYSDDEPDPLIYFADSALQLSDLVPETKPISQLVVLSACESANGKLNQGEGIFSFNRGFAALGIPSCVSNLWSVNNKATYQLTELFYQQLAKGLPLDIALQKAKLEYFNKNNSNQLPYYWAAEILVGKVDPITAGSSFKWKYVIAGASVFMLMIALWWQRRRRNYRDKV